MAARDRPRLPLTPKTRERHVLALPDGIGPDEVEVLAVSRFVAARWEAQPEAPPTRSIVRPMTAAFGIRSAEPTAPVLRLSRHTTLRGPYAVTQDDAVALGLPLGTVEAYVVKCPRERGERPYPGGDREGLKRAFPDGLPIREEERVLLWLVAAARRLGGAVRTSSGAVLTPDVDSAIDLVVLTDRWVEPDQALAIAQRVAPRARLSTPDGAWDGARADGHAGPALRAALDQHGVGDPQERRRLHAESAAFDELMLSAAPQAESFGVVVDLDVDGIVSVGVAQETELPPLLRGLPWTARGVVAYRVHWEPLHVEDLETERPGLAHRVARGRASAQVQALARAFHAAVGGEIADESEFLVDPADL